MAITNTMEKNILLAANLMQSITTYLSFEIYVYCTSLFIYVLGDCIQETQFFLTRQKLLQ